MNWDLAIKLASALAACFSAVAIAAWKVSAVLKHWEVFRGRTEETLAKYKGDVNLAFEKLEAVIDRLREDLRDLEILSHELSSQKAVLVTEVAAIRRELERELVDKQGVLSNRMLEMEKRLSAIERNMR